MYLAGFEELTGGRKPRGREGCATNFEAAGQGGKPFSRYPCHFGLSDQTAVFQRRRQVGWMSQLFAIRGLAMFEVLFPCHPKLTKLAGQARLLGLVLPHTRPLRSLGPD
jgi:hypothetical protein